MTIWRPARTTNEVDGWTDHIHLVVAIPPKRSVAKVVKRVKGASSHYVNEQQVMDEHFAWQEGYGVFTLGETQREAAVAYVRRQKIHHQEHTTNAWLERSQRLEEGPADSGLATVPDLGLLREETAPYLVEVDVPF
jgi:hypothetical protein